MAKIINFNTKEQSESAAQSGIKVTPERDGKALLIDFDNVTLAALFAVYMEVIGIAQFIDAVLDFYLTDNVLLLPSEY